MINKFLIRFSCWKKGVHEPVRYLGGFKCSLCFYTGADLKDMGFDAGYVSLLRKLFTRQYRQITRTYYWGD